MKTVVLALLGIAFCSTVNAAEPAEKPISHYLATATANTFNRLKNIENYTKWIANRVPEDQMKDVKAFFKEKGLTPKTKFPKMTAQNEKVCFEKTYCMTFSSDSVTANGVTFKYYTDKTYRQVLEDICSKIGCEPAKSARISFIPEAHAMSQTLGTLLGVGLGAVVGNLAADSICNGNKTTCTVGGAVLGGLGGYLLTDENKSACGGNCTVTCRNDQYYFQPQPRPVPYDYYGQQRPPYHMNNEVYYRQYGHHPQPCDVYNQPRPVPGRPSDLQIALNQPQRPLYCNGYCNDLPPYQPPIGYQNQLGTPADVRNIQSAPKREKQK